MTHLLALIVGFGSLAIYLAAFFFPEVHRKNDFYWSGVGLFYALVLWFFSPRIGGWFFLGQLAAVTLLFWFGLQTFSLRRQVTPAMQQTPVPSPEAVTSSVKNNISLQERVGGLFKAVSGILPGKKQKATPTATQPATTTSTAEETAAATIGKTLADAIDEETPVSDAPVQIVDNTDTTTTTEIPEVIPPEAPPEELLKAAENADAEEKTIPPVEEIAPDAELAPPAEAPPEKIPPSDLPKE
ncbi:Ycf66 protein N-terminus [Rivularia sp. PCC 7116]|uniref:Ycf66 family protein n=1 Tax=Rivularia sp. PCC 7116 TaxID=373994 RepID=UPI00029F4713|nr:Ycf66 family protein [Rivularia sp. PCC 7116]AFY56807.1 Ycf66 protein N-terminus [Rivularia sp. PCC 7116]